MTKVLFQLYIYVLELRMDLNASFFEHYFESGLLSSEIRKIAPRRPVERMVCLM